MLCPASVLFLPCRLCLETAFGNLPSSLADLADLWHHVTKWIGKAEVSMGSLTSHKEKKGQVQFKMCHRLPVQPGRSSAKWKNGHPTKQAQETLNCCLVAALALLSFFADAACRAHEFTAQQGLWSPQPSLDVLLHLYCVLGSSSREGQGGTRASLPGGC